MERNDMSSRAEQYKKEMMKLYGMRAPAADAECPNNDNDVEKGEISEQIEEDFEHTPEAGIEEECADTNNVTEEIDNSNSPNIADDNSRPEHSYNKIDKYNESNNDTDSESDLTENVEYPALEPEPTANLGESKGIIRVNVRTGQGTEPIVGASVIVTAISDGKRFLIAAGNTDLSGTADLSVPAPDKEYSQTPTPEKMPYSLFDVSVTAKGYFNTRSVDIPVFSGITSVQNFDMIPAPLLTDPADETLTYFNQEPNF